MHRTWLEGVCMTLKDLFDRCAVMQGNGLDAIPPLPGVYVILNMYTKRAYVGSARNTRTRCRSHINGIRMGLTYNGLLRRDLKLFGPFHFVCFVLESFSSESESDPDFLWNLRAAENEWIFNLGTHHEFQGYNAMLYNEWTKGACLRDRERKLCRSSSYYLLDGIDLYDPINPIFLDSWTRDPRVCDRYWMK